LGPPPFHLAKTQRFLANSRGFCSEGDTAQLRSVLAIYGRGLLGFYRRRAQAEAIGDGHTGSVTVIQRFGGGLNLNVHFHTLVLDGVFTADGPETVRFHEAPAGCSTVAKTLFPGRAH
jgi:hypothetical protein